MQLELSSEEGILLLEHLERQLKHVDQELVRTDNRVLQRAIAHDDNALEKIVERLRRALP